NQIEDGRLAGAVGADKRRAHAAPDRETQILDHAQTAETFADRFQTKDGIDRRHPAPPFGNPAATARWRGSARFEPSRRRNCAPVTTPSGRNAMITIKAPANATQRQWALARKTSGSSVNTAAPNSGPIAVWVPPSST